MEIQDLNLRKNPFENITPHLGDTSADLHWAAMEQIKEEIENIYVKKGRFRQLILNWGDWGGGKTFAAQYFRKFPPSIEGMELTQLYIKTPRDGSKAGSLLFTKIIDFLSPSNIIGRIESAINIFGTKELYEFLNDRIHNEPIAKGIIWLGENNYYSKELKERYIYGEITSSELKNIKGLSRRLQSDEDFLVFLIGILLCFIGDGERTNGRVVMWLDETENLLDLNAAQYKKFSQVLRDLVDNLTENFILFLNFTLSEPQLESIQIILGEALWSRIDKKIRFALRDEEKFKYVADLINHYQIRKGNYAPFTKESIDAILDTVKEGNTTPREINKRFNSIIEYSLDNGFKEITVEVVNDWIEFETQIS